MFTIVIPLPNQNSGQEVIDAFKKAATKMSIPNKKWWEAKETCRQTQYEHSPIRKSFKSMGLAISSSSLRKRWCLFGEKVWKPDHVLQFFLPPVVLVDRYKEIRLDIQYILDVLMTGDDKVLTSAEAPEFEHIRPQVEGLIDNFFSALSS